MTNQQRAKLKKKITLNGRYIRKRLDITFDDIIITGDKVAVGNHFCAEGQEIPVILDEVQKIVKQTEKVDKSCLLWYLSNAGMLSIRN